MQPRVAQAGPLIASSATKIAASQTVPGAQGIALTGGSGTYVANNIAASQSIGAAGPITFAAAYAVNATYGTTPSLPTVTLAGQLWFPQIYITSAGNDSGIIFTIQGHDEKGYVVKETISGSNASVACSQFRYSNLYSITASAATAAAITVGSCLPVALDAPRQVLFTSGGNDTGITFAIEGRDANGNRITETVTGGNPTATTQLDYYIIVKIITSGATASTLTVGTNGVARSPWIRLDDWAIGAVAAQAVASGTVNYTIQTSDDDPNSYGNPITPSSMTWDSNQAGVNGATASSAFGLSVAPSWMRVLLNSQTSPGYVRLTVVQSSSVPL